MRKNITFLNYIIGFLMAFVLVGPSLLLAQEAVVPVAVVSSGNVTPLSAVDAIMAATKSKPLPEVLDSVADKPIIMIQSPLNNSISVKSKAVFKGHLINADMLSINGEPIKLNGTQFFHKASLVSPNVYHTFYLEASSSKTHLTTIEKRRVYFVKIFPIKKKKKDSKKSLSLSPNSSQDFQDGMASKIPTVFVSTPQRNLVTPETEILVEGRVTDAKEFFMNSRLISLDKDGSFSEVVELNSVGKYVINMYALGHDNLSTTEIRHVFRVDKSDSSLGVPKKSKLEEGLSKKISLDLSGVDIKDVVQILSKKGHLNIVADKTLAGLVYVSLEDVSILDALDLILNSHGLSYRILDNTILVGPAAKLNTVTRIVPKIIRLNNVRAVDAEAAIKELLTREESVQVLESENMVVLNVDSKKIEIIVGMLAEMDLYRIPQIVVEAQILEVSKSSLDNIGVAWSNTYGIGVDGTLTNGATTYTSSLSLSTIISLLESKGKARVLAKPRIKAINKKEAKIFIGDQLPYIELTTDPSGRVQESVKYVESGINLMLTPDINPITQEVLMEIATDVSYVNGFKGPNNDIPVVRSRAVQTTVIVKNGHTVLIGGLFNSSDTDNVSRFPFLGRIPLIGLLFTANKETRDQTELVIAVTPRIIDTDLEEVIPIQ